MNSIHTSTFTVNTPITDVDETNKKPSDLLQTVQEKFSGNFYISESEVSSALGKLKSYVPIQVKAEHFLSARSITFNSYLIDLINRIVS